MAKTYAIQVLDAQGDVIFSTRGRANALAKAIAAHDDYSAAGARGSGLLFTHDRTRRDGLTVNGERLHYARHLDADMADELVAGFDRRGVAEYEAGCKAALEAVDAARGQSTAEVA